MKPVCQNGSLCNVTLYDVIVWLNNSSAEEYQRLLLHRCLFSPAHRFAHVVFTREANVQVYAETKRKDGSKDNKTLCSTKLWKKQYLHCLPSDPNVRKEWMNFIFNEVPDHVRKNSVLCSLHFTVDLFTNKAQFYVEFSEN